MAMRRGLALLLLATGAAQAGAECDTGVFRLRADYPGAGLGVCTVLDRRTVEWEARPEDGGRINPSPWYGFHVSAVSENAGELAVQLRYAKHEHRYAPKLSADGVAWRRMADADVAETSDGVTLRLRPGRQGVYVSAQENLNDDHYARWRAQAAARTGARWRNVGSSLDGRPIWALHVNSSARNYVLLLGRQHPPEVSGALAFLRFAERLFDMADAACPADPPRCRFFRNHGFVLAPLLNPDGVARGHWRHNRGQTDLNRDWGPFTQPETQAVRDLVDALEGRRKRLRATLDFHSTRRNVFYTQDDAAPTRPARFAERWLTAANASGRALYAAENAPRPLSDLGTSKNYFYRRFGVPSITYEVADEEDRALVATSAAAFAQALVDVFVAEDEAPPPACADAFCFLDAANRASLVMLAEEGLLKADDSAAIAEAVAWVAEEQARPSAARSGNYLDLEARLLELAGPAASNVHLGRSRQDLHGTVRRMQTRQRWLRTARAMQEARRRLLALAEREAATPVPAYTHGVQAQPTTFGHYLLAFSAALGRDAARAREGYARLNRSPLGAAALGTSGFALDRRRLAALLGFDGPVENSLDANLVASADFKLEFAAILGQSAATVGRFAQDVHAQQLDPEPWLALHSSATSDSSIMPQKRNPRPIDRLRSAASAVIGKAQAQLLAAHNVATGMHDYRRIAPLLALADDADEMYRRYAGLADALRVDAVRAAAALARGFSTMTEVADTLVREAGVPFRDAHGYASALVDLCREAGKPAASLTDRELRRVYRETVGETLPVPPRTIRAALDPAMLIAARRGFGGPQPAEMKRSLAAHREALAADDAWLAARQAALSDARASLRDAFERVRLAAGG